jgi:uncharacterized protein with PIN domain
VSGCRSRTKPDSTAAKVEDETALVIEARKGEAGGRELDALVHKAEIVIVAVDAAQVSEARGAYRRFGKGRHGPGSISAGFGLLAAGLGLSAAGFGLLAEAKPEAN